MLIILTKLTILQTNITNKPHFIAECLNYMRVCDTLWPLLLTFSTFSFNVCARFFPTQSSHVLSEKQIIKKENQTEIYLGDWFVVFKFPGQENQVIILCLTNTKSK
jgi:hypothetical protein